MIITEQQMSQFRQIGANVPSARLTPYIAEVEQLYVMPALGVSLYHEIEKQAIEGKDIDTTLIDGGYYGTGKEEGWCPGIIAAVAYLAYARFLPNQQINVTAYGVVNKTGEHSQKADEASIIRQANQSRETGEKYLQLVVNYLRFLGKIVEHRRVPRQTTITIV